MEWNLSAKTADDLRMYQDHYNEAAKTSSASSKISIQSKLIGATRAYRSNEIQRSSIGVLEGSMDNVSKQNLMIGLYNSSLDNGDYDAAQNLRNQIDTLQNTIIAEQTAALNTAKRMAEAGYSTIKAYVTDLKNGSAKIFDSGDGNAMSLNDINNLYKQYGEAGMAPFFAKFAAANGVPITSYVDIANTYAKTMMTELQTSASNLIGEDRASVMNDIIDYNNGAKKISIPGMVGDDKGITIDDLNRAVESQANGTSPIIASQNSNGGRPGFVPAKVQSWAITTDANGVSKPTVVYRQQQAGEGVGKDALVNFNVTDAAGNMGVSATTATGQPYGGGTLFKAPNGDLIDKTGKVVVKASEVPMLEAKGVTFKTADKIAAEKALQDRGFTTYADNTVDLPQGAQIPDIYKGQKAVSYNVDTNGLVQFAFENKTGDPKSPYQRSILVYDPKTNLYTSTLEAGNYTIANKTYNKVGELIGSGGPGQNINPVPAVQTPKVGTSAYDAAYAKQRETVPGLPADPNKGSYTVGGVTYNAAGDPINKMPPVQTPIAPYVAPAPKLIPQPSNIGTMASNALKQPAAPTTKTSAPIVLSNKLSF
jgi:hypothetical protein